MKKFKFLLIMPLTVSALSAQTDNFPPLAFAVGSFNVTILTETQSTGNKGILIDASKDILDKCLPDGTFKSAINAYLVESGEHRILIDAGLGSRLVQNIETCKLKAADIDVILLTHMHGDHIGGLLKDGAKVFPNATIYLAKAEYDYWMQDVTNLPAERRQGFTRAQAIVKAYGEKVKTFVPEAVEKSSGAAKELLPGIKAIAAYGHTPGHTVFLLDSDGSRMLVWGDVTHCTPVQIPNPQIAVTYDVDPKKAIESRQLIMDYVAKNNIRVAGMHIEYPGLVDIKGDVSSGYTYKMVCNCEGTIR